MYCIYELYTVVAMYAHLKTMTTDPGAVPRAALPLPSDVMEMDHEANRVMALKNNTNNSNEKVLMDKFKKTCKRCAAFKPIRAHHCSICGRCVVKMDHHCPVPSQLDFFLLLLLLLLLPRLSSSFAFFHSLLLLHYLLLFIIKHCICM